MRLALFVTCLFAMSCAHAQGSQIPDPVIRTLAKDLAELQQAVLAAQKQQQAGIDKMNVFSQAGVASITVTSAYAKVRAGAADGAPPLAQIAAGKKFRVVDKMDNWYAVSLDKPIKGLQTGWVSAADAVPMLAGGDVIPSLVQQQTASEAVFRSLTEHAARLRQAYKDNPYVSVSGFQVNVGAPLSVSINFEFK